MITKEELYELMEKMDSNHISGRNNFFVHAELGKLLFKLGKIDDNSALYLSCSHEEDAKALSEYYFTNKNNYDQEISNEMTGRARVA